MLIVVFDIGNTKVKWGIARHETLLAVENAFLDDKENVLACLRLLPIPQKVVVANVAGEKAAFIVSALPKLWPTSQIIEVSSLPFAAGVKNTYDMPETLGVDRFAALVAAWQLYHGASLVVNAGTALTVDCLDDQGIFLGGVIVPGRYLMGKALLQYTAGVKSWEGTKKDFPQNTADAITTGTALALAGTIVFMQKKFSCLGPHEIILTGGDAISLQALLPFPCRIEANLILHGLVKLAHEPHLFYSRSPAKASKS
jgi:type III pantothenate kinase